MKSFIKSGIKKAFFIGLFTIVFQNFCAVGQSNIEQDPVNSSNIVRLNQNQTNQTRPVQRLRIPENLIQIQKVTVPRLIDRNFNVDEITAFLDELGLQLGEVVPVANNQQAGRIINQYPPSGREVNLQTRINLAYGIETISDVVAVPRYIGLTVRRAVARMPNDRLTVGEIVEVNSEMPPGIVVGQFPEEGLNVDPQTRINLNVSNGIVDEPKIRVPNLVGFSLQQAAEKLQETGLFAGRIVGRQTSAEPGIVVEQSPAPGTEVDTKSTVNIVFSEQEIVDFVTVPKVVGLPKNEAILVLKENNLRYAQQFVRNSGNPEGIVTRQDIPPGKQVPPDTLVVIQIQDKGAVPPWVFWGGGILIAGVAGGLIGRKINTSKKKKIVGEKNINVDLKLVWDIGKQSVTSTNDKHVSNKIRLKYITDLGKQSVK